MNEELMQVDADLKGLFTESKYDEMNSFLAEQPENDVKEISSYNWSIVKKYYETEKFDLLFTHFRFVAYSCYVVEYAHRASLISDEAFTIMMQVYGDIYELKRKHRLDNTEA